MGYDDVPEESIRDAMTRQEYNALMTNAIIGFEFNRDYFVSANGSSELMRDETVKIQEQPIGGGVDWEPYYEHKFQYYQADKCKFPLKNGYFFTTEYIESYPQNELVQNTTEYDPYDKEQRKVFSPTGQELFTIFLRTRSHIVLKETSSEYLLGVSTGVPKEYYDYIWNSETYTFQKKLISSVDFGNGIFFMQDGQWTTLTTDRCRNQLFVATEKIDSWYADIQKIS